jgi:hypothetical protein|uniref:Uncharacterized protein n=1 Tax=viral metagenome TaxID=1070528 RepID=A0A6C0I044_9ZZZZ
MNLIISTNQFKSIYLHFLERKSNIIIDGVFSKLLYSNNNFIMNGLFIECPFQSLNPKKYNLSLLDFDVTNNKEIIKQISDIEKQILLYYMHFFQITNKICTYDLSYKMQNGSLKYYYSTSSNKYSVHKPEYYIKISGIWETDTQIGLTYKLIEYRCK